MQLLTADGNWEPIADVFAEPLPTNRVPPLKILIIISNYYKTKQINIKIF